uniref:Uncharacterized protein n=2 Tax=Odontella aurita TaxID=265563 RepID=A0A7S4IX77_9STRA|mmetsp:Transcript_31695/g.94844  ORF Transcript_31695/g.94844 Transcript_31695/m.94844 type:complete len:322 (+) Transcript_31695:96-1061(+)
MRRITPSEKKVELSREEEPDLHAISREHPIPDLPELAQPAVEGSNTLRQQQQRPQQLSQQMASLQSLSSSISQQSQFMASLVPQATSTTALARAAAAETPTRPAAVAPSIAFPLHQPIRQQQPHPPLNALESTTIAAAAAQRRYLEASAALCRAREEENAIAQARDLFQLSSQYDLACPLLASIRGGDVRRRSDIGRDMVGAGPVAPNLSAVAVARANALLRAANVPAASLSRPVIPPNDQVPSIVLRSPLSSLSGQASTLDLSRGGLSASLQLDRNSLNNAGGQLQGGGREEDGDGLAQQDELRFQGLYLPRENDRSSRG